MDLNEVMVFVEVVRAGSFTAAGLALEMPKSSVSRKVAQLEDRLGVQLLHRTTRSLRLSDVGEAYYARCLRVVAEAEAAEQLVGDLQAVPCGRLRITAPPALSALGSIVAEYLAKYPGVRVELVCTDRVVDLLAEGFDLAIRAGRLEDSALIARKLGTATRVLVATPAYLEGRGVPKQPADLPEHDLIVFSGGREEGVWRLISKRKQVDIQPTPRLVVNDYELVRAAVRSGLGIALLPGYLSREDLEDGALVRVLPAWATAETPIRALFPAGRHKSIKLTAFLDLLQARFSLGSDRRSKGGTARPKRDR